MPVFADERKARIAQHVLAHQRATVSELAQMFQASESTIRRDLQELEEQGVLRRTHGGAVAKEIAAFEPTWSEKRIQNQEAKMHIAALALELVRPGQVVLLDAGTTTYELARQWRHEGVTVVTNSLDIASELRSRRELELVLLGGQFRAKTGAFVGPFAERMLDELHVDIAFLGANGVDFRGFTTPNLQEAAVKRAMVRCADRAVLVADRTKLDQIAFVRVATWDEIDTWISDGPLPEGEWRRWQAEAEVEFICEREDGGVRG
ncbi:DeoR/GlpR family DNA-binding transcription regulator [Alicyclobacillus sendaiensis]|uniref:DeoR/GlpR family DNA-binding transcription regulator n=1 Tax=Alicyclobacillus sendaiensis PA2 TaxID=3029425 RepID=A0ABT6XUA9_ALISE|nr:DeoR/GlpR family DNA-binding transcription regulator [Alicyclobacillus sendaiensis]MDI9258618.1 DeoR/GlpR family DNA-binding transcription regulator [Alicyclobacillus sendaiensis PA2]